MAEKREAGERGGKRLGRIGDRSYPALWLSIAIRAAHQVGAAVFLTVYLLEPGVSPPPFYVILVTVSGVVLVLTEWLRHRQLYRELAGVVTLGKCLLLGAALHGFLPIAPVVLLVFLLASVGAHAPKNVRHRLLP